MFLPSTLEYSKEALEKKLIQVQSNLDFFTEIQKPKTQQLAFHLDLVLSQFAKDRGVMQSIGLKTSFDLFNTYFKTQELDLSIHLMGALEDLKGCLDFFETHSFNSNWSYTIFVPESYTNLFQSITVDRTKVRVGIWLDKGNWQVVKFDSNQVKDHLLMTVVAGKSGQKLTSQLVEDVIATTKLNPDLNFIADGGWAVDFDPVPTNLQIVSYSSFWQKFSSKINLNS